MEQNKPQHEEKEVELVPIFVWIGRGISSFFNGIGRFFASLGHLFLLFLIFLQRNLLLVVGITILGGALGWYLNKQAKSSYTGEMIVQPNFNSNSQLISKVDYYQSLINESNTKQLGKELAITSEQASSLLSITIEPFYNKNELIESYDELARKSDSVAVSNLDYDEYANAYRKNDYQHYKIEASSKNPYAVNKLFSKLENLEETSAIAANKLAEQTSAEYNLLNFQNQQELVGNLILAYQNAIAANSANPSLSRPEQLFVGNQRPDDTYKNLFEERTLILKEVEKARAVKYQLTGTVNVLSKFVGKGTLKKNHFVLEGAALFFCLGILVAAIPNVWRFLKDYEERSAS